METIEFLEPLYESLELLISRYGYMGVAVAMFAESAGVPFASSIVFLTAGSMILRGSCSFWSIFIASTIGITLGSVFSYSIGLLGSLAGKAVKVQINKKNNYYNNLNQSNNNTTKPYQSKILSLMDKYGNFSIFMGQLWGFSRTFISFPAGAMHMNFLLFIIYTFLGGALFSLLTIGASIIFTSTLSLVVKALITLFDFSPWLLLIPLFLIILLIYLYRSKGWKINFTVFNSLWKRVANALKKS